MGRPSKFKPEMLRQVEKLCRLGATDKELADFFEVAVSTVDLWKVEHPEFSESIKSGKAIADAEVADKLFKRATGYEHPDTHISNYQGAITKTEIVKHYPPDTVAAIFWLKNRRPDQWRDKHDVDVHHKITLEGLIEQSMAQPKTETDESRITH